MLTKEKSTTSQQPPVEAFINNTIVGDIPTPTAKEEAENVEVNSPALTVSIPNIPSAEKKQEAQPQKEQFSFVKIIGNLYDSTRDNFKKTRKEDSNDGTTYLKFEGEADDTAIKFYSTSMCCQQPTEKNLRIIAQLLAIAAKNKDIEFIITGKEKDIKQLKLELAKIPNSQQLENIYIQTSDGKKTTYSQYSKPQQKSPSCMQPPPPPFPSRLPNFESNEKETLDSNLGHISPFSAKN